MSRNQDRLLGQDKPQHADPPQQSNSMEWVMPTEHVALPSKGLLYPDGHPLQGIEDVEIKFMSAKEEDILTSKTLLKKGIAIDRMLQSLLVNKAIQLDSMLLGDKNALIVAARITGYGEKYETHIICPKCAEKFDYEFDLLQMVTKPGVTSPDVLKEHDVELTSNNTILMTLPKSGVQVECRFLGGADEKYLLKSAEMKRKQNLGESALTDQYKAFIVSVNGDSNKGTVAKFINAMPALDSRYLRTIYAELAPNVDMSQTIECPECGEESKVQIPLTSGFFWPQ